MFHSLCRGFREEENGMKKILILFPVSALAVSLLGRRQPPSAAKAPEDASAFPMHQDSDHDPKTSIAAELVEKLNCAMIGKCPKPCYMGPSCPNCRNIVCRPPGYAPRALKRPTDSVKMVMP